MFLERTRRGFTLVEIMIAVAVIGILAAIAIPNLLRARVNANEGAVKSELKTFSHACESYRAVQNPPAFPANILALTGVSPPYLDPSWVEGGTKHGFVLSYLVGDGTFSLLATPVANAANNTYCIDQTGVVTGSTVDGTATIPVAAADGCSAGTPITG